MPSKSHLLTHLPPSETSGSTPQPIIKIPVRVRYQANLAVISEETQDGETVFTWYKSRQTRRVPGMPPPKFPTPTEITAEFFAADTKRKALDFLRATGIFLPMQPSISWPEFQRWQHFAVLVRLRKTLASVHELLLSDKADEKLDATDPGGDLRRIVRALEGELTYFDYSGMDHLPVEGRLTRKSFVNTQAYARYRRNPGKSAHDVQAERYSEYSELQKWFGAPPHQACSIQWEPLIDDARSPAKPSAIPNLNDPTKFAPIIQIEASCTLHAIAATLYADRLAGVDFLECKECKRPFPANSKGTREYCTQTCRNTFRTRVYRDKKDKLLKSTAHTPSG